MGSCAAVRSVFSRSFLGKIGEGIREVKEMEILRNSTFLVAGSSFFFLFYVLRLFLRVGTPRAQYSKCHPRHFFILGLSLVLRWSLTRGELGRCKGRGILRKSTFCASTGGVALKAR